jgi:predicted nucleic acid-binding protein
MISRVPTENYVIDSFAWFEYFIGSIRGEKARPFIESGNGITPTIVIAELSEKYKRARVPFGDDLSFISIKTRVLPLDTEIADSAGVLSHERKSKVKRWGLADSIVLATARANEAKVVTGDEHFRDLSTDSIMIK